MAAGSHSLPHKIHSIATTIREWGGRALLVGGYVRDELWGLHPKDADIEVYGIPAETLRELLKKFGRIDCVGESFRVYKLVWRERKDRHPVRHELDISLPRRDRKVGQGHRGFEVEGDPDATVEDAARRRDFTINAIMRDPLTDELIDPFHGREDLQAGILRAVDPKHFGEDSLRVLRAMQFAGRFNLHVESNTVELCRSIDLSDLPKERIWGEWEKLLLKSERPSIGLMAARQLHIFQKLFPYLEVALQRRGDMLLKTIDAAAHEKKELPYEEQVTLMLAAIGSYLGWRGTRQLLDDLGVFSLRGYDVRANVIRISGERNRARHWYRRRDAIPDREFRFLSARCEPRLVYHLARSRGDVAAAEWFIAKMEQLGVADGPPEPLLMGRHLIELGMQPGPQFGELLRDIYLRQLAGEITTYEEAVKTIESQRRRVI